MTQYKEESIEYILVTSGMVVPVAILVVPIAGDENCGDVSLRRNSMLLSTFPPFSRSARSAALASNPIDKSSSISEFPMKLSMGFGETIRMFEKILKNALTL